MTDGACPGGGGLRFGFVGDVPLAAHDPYPCSGVIFPKKVPIFRDFSEKREPFLAILSKLGKPRKILKIGPIIVRDFFMKNGSLLKRLSF